MPDISRAAGMRLCENGRLVYYKARPDREFWDAHWSGSLNREAYGPFENGELGWLEDPFVRYLPKDYPVLEAGCGTAQFVVALSVRGYRAEGVDWAPETVQAVRELFPALPVRSGDVTRLDVPDGHYGGYISLGVIEHRREGPGPFLSEAWRVLRPGGVALFSVPWFNGLRRLKGRLGLYRGDPGGLDFYQYAFSEKELGWFLAEAGFEVLELLPYDGVKGIKDEVPLVERLLRRRGVGWRLRRALGSHFVCSRWGHMLLAACRKKDRPL